MSLSLSLYFLDYKISLKFISENSRVAPIKTISVSRLELMGNLVLAPLTDFLKKYFETTCHGSNLTTRKWRLL